MKNLNGKKIKIWDMNGNLYEGLCTGSSDDIIKMMISDSKDERIFFIKNIFAYEVVGEGTSGGYSGLNVYICKNDEINCKGKILISTKENHIKDMKCEICNKNTDFKCNFYCLGALEVIPSKIQRILLDDILFSKQETKNYLKEAMDSIKKDNKK